MDDFSYEVEKKAHITYHSCQHIAYQLNKKDVVKKPAAFSE